MNYYVTFCDQNYLPTVEKLFDSLRIHSNNKLLFYTINFDYTSKYENVIPIRYNSNFSKVEVHLSQQTLSDREWQHAKHLFLKPAILLDSIKSFGFDSNFCFIDADNLAIKNCDTVFDYCKFIIDYPLAGQDCQDFLYYDGRGDVFLEDESNELKMDLNLCLEANLFKFLNIDIKKRTLLQRQTNVLIYNNECEAFVKEWDKLCRNTTILNDWKNYAPYGDQTIFNCLVWRDEHENHLNQISINNPKVIPNVLEVNCEDFVKNLFYPPTETTWLNSYVKIPAIDKIDNIKFLHGKMSVEDHNYVFKNFILNKPFEKRFGIYTSFYNAEEFIDDIFSQFEKIEYTNWKWIVTDDFSTDNTAELLREKCKHYHFVEFVEQSHKKEMYWQPNKFFDQSYDYIVLMDCDDEFDPKFLEIYNHFARAYPEAAYITSDMIKENENSIHSLSLIQNHTKLYNKLESYHPEIDYVRNNSYYCLGYLRCFKNYPDLEFKIKDFEACAEDSYRAMWMNSIGRWIHIPRVLYKWVMRPSSESHSVSLENFNSNFDGAHKKLENYCFDPYFDYQDVYKETSSFGLIGINELHGKKICILTGSLTDEQKQKLKNLYFDCEVFFDKEPNCDYYNIITNYYSQEAIQDMISWIRNHAGACKITSYYHDEMRHERMNDLQNNIACNFQNICSLHQSYFMYFRHNYATTIQQAKTKILFLAPHLSTGGSPAYLEWLIQEKINEGYEVEVLEYCYYGSFDVQRKRIIDLVGKDKFKSFCVHWDTDEHIISRGQKVVDMIVKSNPDIIHINELPEIFCYKPLVKELTDFLYDKDRKFKVIETCHTSEFDFQKKEYIPDEFYFCSRFHLDASQHIHIPKTIVEMQIQAKERPSREQALSSLDLDPSYFHVLNVGLFNEFKNQKYIFELANELRHEKIKFHFIGNDCWLKNCGIPEDFLKLPNCVIHGEKNNVDEYMAATDLFLFPSLKELNPICLKEALSWQMPVFAYNLDSYKGAFDSNPLFNYIQGDNVKQFLVKQKREVYKNVINESGSLGDTLAWAPIASEYARAKGIIVNYYTPLKHILEDSYPNLNFFNYNEKDNIASGIGVDMKVTPLNTISIGCFNGSDWQTKNLQKVASDILGLPAKEIRCQISHKFKKQNNFNKKYVCIGTQSTAQAKYWNNPDGWKQTVQYLNSLGYEVVCIDKNSSYGIEGNMNYMPEGCVDKTGDLPLEDRINDLFHCEFFIGLGSGLSWLAWACGKPVIMISGFSADYAEFSSPYRVINKDVCNSCWNDTSCKFDSSNWMWCPREKNFECSKKISFEMVKEKIDQCIKTI